MSAGVTSKGSESVRWDPTAFSMAAMMALLVLFHIQAQLIRHKPASRPWPGTRPPVGPRRFVLQQQMGEHTDADQLSVEIIAVQCRNNCQTSGYGMGGCQAAAFKSHPAQQGIGFNDLLKSFIDLSGRTAAAAANPFSRMVSAQSFPMARAAIVGRAPTMDRAWGFSKQVRAS